MPEALDFVYGFCATSLIGYVVGWPVGSLGAPEGRRPRFLGVAALAGGGALLARGWPPIPAIVLGLVGAIVAVGVDELIRGPSRPEPKPKPEPKPEPKAETQAKKAKPEPEATKEPEDLPVPDMVHDEAAASRSQRTMHGAPVAEPEKLEAPKAVEPAPEPAKPGSWKEPAQSTDPGTTKAPDRASWEEPGAAATGPLPVMGKKARAMDDVDLEELYEEVDAALHVVPAECPHCGHTGNVADARFCKKCSAPLKPWRCNNCSRVNDIDASFCVRCREPLQMLASPLDVEVIDE